MLDWLALSAVMSSIPAGIRLLGGRSAVLQSNGEVQQPDPRRQQSTRSRQNGSALTGGAETVYLCGRE